MNNKAFLMMSGTHLWYNTKINLLGKNKNNEIIFP